MRHNFWLILCFLSSLSLFNSGCQDTTFYKVDDENPEIVVYPEQINFGHIRSGYESGVENFIVMNAGNDVLSIDNPVVVLGEDRFKLDGPEVITLSPEEYVEYTVTYVPETYEENYGTIEILSSDSNEELSYVGLAGFGDAPVISISPEDVDYGDISLGCDNEERITIKNEGNLNLVVESVLQLVNQPVDILLEYGSLSDPPWELEPETSLDFLVSYIPQDVGYDESIISIKSNDPIRPEVEAIQMGNTDYLQTFTEAWQQEPVPVVDIIWVIDDSGSMSIFQSMLAQQMTDFMDQFLIANPDFHMGFITTSDHTWQSQTQDLWIDRYHPDAVGWSSSVITGIGVYGSGMERGIEMAANALQDNNVAGPNSSFYRENASLAIIYLSDEPDFSSGSWQNYTWFFDGLKPSVDAVKMYGVISDYPAGCEYVTPTGYSRQLQPGYGYYEIINYYNGSWYSICAPDWGVQLKDLADQVSETAVFQLSETDIIESSIEVFVNGQKTEEWIYDVAINSVIFDENAVPSEGQTIEITYAIAGC